MVSEIKDWLSNSGSYKMGIDLMSLLLQDNQITKVEYDLCASAQTDFSMKKIRSSFEKYLEKVSTGKVKELRKAAMPKTSNVKKDLPQKSAPVDFSKLPEDLISLDREIKDYYAKNRTIKGQLKALLYTSEGTPKSKKATFRTKDERRALAEMAVSNQKYIDAMWKRIDYFNLTGMRLPGTDPTTERRQIAIWLRDLPQYVNYIRQANSKFNRTGVYNNKELYDEYVLQLDKINKYIAEWL